MLKYHLFSGPKSNFSKRRANLFSSRVSDADHRDQYRSLPHSLSQSNSEEEAPNPNLRSSIEIEMAATTTVASTLRPTGRNLLRTTTAGPTLISKPLSIKLKTAPLHQRRMEQPGNATVLPVIRAQSSQDYVPDAKFYKVEAIVRQWRVPHVSSGLLKMGIRGVTISEVKGFGAQGGSTERQAGSEFSEDKFVAKTKMEIVVSKDQVEAVIQKIIEEARTGEIGDGKIFVMPVSDIIRVRTGERDEKAEKMAGGRSDMISALSSD